MILQCRFFKSIGVDFECEKSDRLERDILLGEHLQGKMMEFVFKDSSHPKSNSNGPIRKDAPVVYVDNLEKFIKCLLDRYDR